MFFKFLQTWTDLINSARQNLMFLSEGSRLAPLSQHHVKVLKLVGYEDERLASCPVKRPCNIGFPAAPSKRMMLDVGQASTSRSCAAGQSRPSLSTLFPSPNDDQQCVSPVPLQNTYDARRASLNSASGASGAAATATSTGKNYFVYICNM